ncbi:MAG: asparagine synthase (glutamine-hydrolyzing) [Solirubrobacteraceae bacterium]|nr:asparagine synthase (glutamine-hydrolyzing) [Solirubrobacteraceae bacterium]
MCGIAGFQGRSPQRGKLLADALEHRGPDGAWVTERGDVTLVQTRLAVIDLSDRVRYPMVSASGDLAMVFNGEIYGFLDLRRELEALGHVFRTECDAEVLLNGYVEWGEGVFGRVDGMFAVAIADLRDGSLLLVRDPLGIKPMAYTTGSGAFAFSSDAISLVAAGFSAGDLDLAALGAHAALHYVPAPATGIRDVAQLEPGHLLRVLKGGERQLERWASSPLRPPAPQSSVPLHEVRDALESSVRKQSVADVPVGVFLSGGIDSALVLSAAVRAGHRPIAFTIGFPGSGDYDEVQPAADMARALGVPHRHESLAGGFADTVDSIADAFDVPFADSSAIATVQLARLAREDVTVALSGTGGDELFGGYDRYRAHRLLQLLRLIPRPARSLLADLEPPRGSERQTRAAVIRSRVARLAAQNPADFVGQYMGLVADMSSSDVSRVSALQPSRPRWMSPDLEPGDTILRALCRLDLETYLPGDVLVKEDRASMAVGLEARVPMLGGAMLELSGRLPDAQKVRRNQGKVALRQLANDLTPTGEHSRAPKRGFAVPLGPLLDGDWRDEARNVLREAEGVVNGALALEAFDRGELTPADVWMLANLDRWSARVARARRSAVHLLDGPALG